MGKGLSAEANLAPLSQKNLEHLTLPKHNSHPCQRHLLSAWTRHSSLPDVVSELLYDSSQGVLGIIRHGVRLIQDDQFVAAGIERF